MNRILIFASAAILLVGPGLFAKTIEVPVSQVAVISPDEDEEDMALGPRVCLRFAFPDDIQGQEIGHAELVMTLGQIDNIPDDSILVFEAYLLTSNWSENVGWDDFSTPGGDIDSSNYASCSIGPRNSGHLRLDVSEMVNLWNSQGRDNYGLILIPRNTAFDGFRAFAFSREQLRSMVSMKIIVPGRDE